MPGAVSIQITPQGVRSVVVEQELIFFIGPSPINRLDKRGDFERRMAEVDPFITGGSRHSELVDLFERSYGVRIKTLAATVRSGGMKGHHCPNLCIDLVESVIEGGACLFQVCDPHKDINNCRGLITLLDADWVNLWWMGSLGNAQLTCERSGEAVWFKGNGKQEVLS
jgi:hypothetical protein